MNQILKDLLKKHPQVEYWSRKAYSLLPQGNGLGRDFWEFYQLLQETQHADPARLAELQFAALKDTLRFAYRNSGFYRRLYDEHGCNVEAIHSFEDFQRTVPIVDKSLLKAASDLTVPQKGMWLATTSGTTGSPFQFYSDPVCDAKEMAAIYHQWARAGFRPGDIRIEMRGFQEAPIVHYPDKRVIRVSVLHMERHFQEILTFLNKARVPYFHGYPSAVLKFARLLEERNDRLEFDLKGVFLASENVFPVQVEEIRRVLSPKAVIAHYGSAERVVLGAWCETNPSYHFLPLYGYMEVGPANEIIGTGFINRATPIIRYRTTDLLVDREDRPCAQCGRGYTPLVGTIGGRMEEYLVNESSELVPPALVTFPFKNLQAIREVQVVQDESRHVRLRYKAMQGADELLRADQAILVTSFQKLLGSSIRVEFEDVKEIPLTDACKFKWIISHAKQQ